VGDPVSPSGLGAVPDLPSLPVVATLAIGVSSDPDSTASDLLRVIMSDPPLAAKVLRVANSVYYQRGGADVKDLQTAIVRLGFSNVRNLLVGLSVIRSFDPFFVGAPYTREDFWVHSISTGLLAARLTRTAANLSSSTAFIAGLLHDVGKLVLDRQLRDAWSQALSLSRLAALPLHEAELRTMGSDHAQVGASVLEAWKLPSELVEPVRWHHRPAGAPVHHRVHAAAVLLADYFCIHHRLGYSGNEHPPLPAKALLDEFRTTDEAVAEAVRDLEQSPLLGVLLPV
jgi:putative nucleotidyltransferase with HDIG domain